MKGDARCVGYCEKFRLMVNRDQRRAQKSASDAISGGISSRGDFAAFVFLTFNLHIQEERRGASEGGLHNPVELR